MKVNRLSIPHFKAIVIAKKINEASEIAMKNGVSEFERHESRVRYYCRRIPKVFETARNALLWDEDGIEYIDFLSGCGSLNYGHNHPLLKLAANDFLAKDHVLNGLDFYTVTKRDFIRKFQEQILEPRGLEYKMQFTGPTGTNAVEAALKLARKVTGRRTVVAFTNAFHGMSLGALAATGNSNARSASSELLTSVIRLPFDGYEGADFKDLDRFAAMVKDPSSGIDPPAAFIVETVQGEGGLNVASTLWLKRLADIAHQLRSLLIVDDIQAGCGRTGTFFSFETIGIVPDLVCLSKSLSGIGLPMALLLVSPKHDVWSPGEHSGTFRGNNLAFATASAAIDFWLNPGFEKQILDQSRQIRNALDNLVYQNPNLTLAIKGRGAMLGLALPDEKMTAAALKNAIERQLVIETVGPRDEVLKIIPPLTIEPKVLQEGLHRFTEAVQTAIRARVNRPAKVA